MRRRTLECTSDESYVGTALSYWLAERNESLAEQADGDLAMAVATQAGGFKEEEVTEETVAELRNSSPKWTIDFWADHRRTKGCRAVER